MKRITALVWMVSCAPDPLPTELTSAPPLPYDGPGNVLLFVADDVGIDRLSAWEVGEHMAHTPTIDGLVAEGVRYTRVWAQSLCSPGRAAIQTGRQPYHTGIGSALPARTLYPLADEEDTLPELIATRSDLPYASAYVGKWHLSSSHLPGDGYRRNPNDQGWGSFAGLMVGLDADSAFDLLPQDYWDWERTVDGVPARSSTYVTTANADDAIAAITGLPEPWLVQVAFMAPHAPVHWPPDELWSGEIVGTSEDQQKTNAMIEAMDTEIGRVIDALADRRPRTTIFFTADNGTETRAVSAPYDIAHAKASPFEGGLRVPLVAAGYRVERRGETCDHLVQTSDLFATIADLAGASLDPAVDVDAVSFVPTLSDPAAEPARTVAFAELFHPSGDPPYREHFVTIRDDRYKFVRWLRPEETEDGPPIDATLFFDVGRSPTEGPDLVALGLDEAQRQAFDALVAQLPTAMP